MSEASRRVALHATVNGERIDAEVAARVNLVDFLRDGLGLTGSHVGCEHGVCGACTVLVDGALVRGCLMLAAQIDGCVVETIEGADGSGRLATLQACFHEHNALQCGFCTPGMLLTAAALLERESDPGRAAIREALSGNLCRCTGYQAIVDAVQDAALRLRQAPPT
jgi:carbon-monoxide dehydrogenase small subunit